MASKVTVTCPECGATFEIDLGLYGMSCTVQEDLGGKQICGDISTVTIGTPASAVKDCPKIKSVDNIKTLID